MIPKELLKKLRHIEIHTARLANEQLAGGYHSVFKGRGMAFSEVRQYQAGDDVRFIDWNVSARMNEAYVKVFTEEREMTVMLVVDVSRSLEFGTADHRKREVLAEVSALLAFSAITNSDRVGLILFSDRIERYIPPKKGKAHVMRVVMELLQHRPVGHGTSISVALELLSRMSRRRSIAFVVSDFLSAGYTRALRLSTRRHDIIPITVSDAREEALPNVGIALFEDLESGAVVEVDTASPTLRRRYREMAQEEWSLRERGFRALSLDSLVIRTGEDCVKPIADLFRRRQRRLRGYR